MLSQKRKNSEVVSDPEIKKILRFEDAPPVKSITDLIELGKSIKFYRNIDTTMLWRMEPYLQELNDMVGMESLKQTIFYQIIYYLQGMHMNGVNGMNNTDKNQEYLHTVIYGPPGCGKTTIAKIIGNIYKAMNVLSSDGTFTVAHRDDFVGGYLGQTALKTKKLLKSCLGGVLFIDEVYSLAPKKQDQDSFSKEAIDTITGFLSEHKNEFCCIIAGYEDDVANCFFSSNKGLERRFPWVHRIIDYSAEQLSKIFMKMVDDCGWDIAFEEKVLIQFIQENKGMFKNAGGDMETFLTKCKMMHSKRVFSLSQEHKFILSKQDIQEAVKFMGKNKTVKNDPPFGLYT